MPSIPPRALTTTCDCGAVSITLPKLPLQITACPCSFCTRMGAAWGYFPKETVTVSGPTDTYRRGQKRLAFHRCKTCGALTHWAAVTVDWQNTGVNMRNFPADMLQDIPVTQDA